MSTIMKGKWEGGKERPPSPNQGRGNILLSIIHGGDITFHYSIRPLFSGHSQKSFNRVIDSLVH